MAIGRISGSVLKSNLTRNGTDLAFETNLLYLDVTNSRIGIGTSEPSTALQVSGTVNATAFVGDGSGLQNLPASFGDLTAVGSTIISPSNANITLDPGGTGTIDVSSAKITSLGTPTADADAATKAYVDTQVSSVSTTSITEGNTNVTVADSGTGSVTITADGNTEVVINDTDATFSGPVVIKGQNAITLNDSDNSNYIQLRAPSAVTSNTTHTLPDGYGSSGQVLSTNGSGTLSWADQSGSSVRYPNSTYTILPGSSGDYDLAEGTAQDGDETPFDANSTDAFGISLTAVFDMSDPVGATETTDLGSGEAYVGA